MRTRHDLAVSEGAVVAAAPAQGGRAPRGAAVPSRRRRWRNAGPTGCPTTRPRGPRGATWATRPSCGKTHARCGRGCCSSNWRRMSATAFAACSRTACSPALAALSLALGIGANTAIYSFMDAILLRSLPVADPASLIVVKWHSGPVNFGSGDQFVMHSIDGSTYRDPSGVIAAIFPFPAFERLREASAPVLSSLFAHKPAGGVNVIVKGEAELVQGRVRLRRLLPWPCRGAGGGAPDPWRRRSRRRRTGRGPERGIQPAPVRRCRPAPSGRRFSSTA